MLTIMPSAKIAQMVYAQLNKMATRASIEAHLEANTMGPLETIAIKIDTSKGHSH